MLSALTETDRDCRTAQTLILGQRIDKTYIDKTGLTELILDAIQCE